MKIGFIGCGNMASAMIGGILKKGIVKKEEIIVSNLTEAGSRRSREKLGVETTMDNRQVVTQAEIVFLAVKPQFYEEVLTEIKDLLTEKHILVGIAPGKTLKWLEDTCGCPVKTVRLMPNTPAQVGAGMTAGCCNDRVTEDEAQKIREIAESFGRFEFIPERLIIEAMADAAVAQGLPRSQAYSFAAQAVMGSAKMVLETGRHPAELKDMVCSPAGSTIEGVRILEDKGMRSAVFEALTGAAEKGKRL